MKVTIILLCSIWCLQAQWLIDTVEPGIANYSKSYIILDPLNDPHIAYLPCYTTTLKYAKWEYDIWRLATVTNDAYTTAGGPTVALSMALSDGFLPYITYTTGTESSQRLKLARYNGLDWDTLHIDGPQVSKASLVLIDSAGPPCVGYQYQSLQKFAYYQGGFWLYDTIGDGSYPSGKVSLCLDNGGAFHYVYDINSFIIYAHGSLSNWSLDTVDQGVYTSMNLDGNNLPHVVYTKPFNTDLWYAFYNGANWVSTLVDTGCGTGPQLIAPSMDIDSTGHVHICYLQQTNTSGTYRLKYALYDGSTWYFEVVDEGFAWHVPSLTVTESGSVHISYFNGSSLLHAFRDPVGIKEEKVIAKKTSSVDKVVAFPNPFVSFTALIGFENELLQVYDITGALQGCYHGSYIGEDLNAGVYFVKLGKEEKKLVRIIKIR